MTKGTVLLLLLQGLAIAANAQSSVKVQLPAGNYAVFASPGPALTAPPEPILSKGGSVDVPLGAGFDHVYVWNKLTGAMADKSVSAKPGKWIVTPSSFNRIESLTVQAVHNDQPLSAGEVSLGDGDPRHTGVVLDSHGPATFFDVPAGNLKVTVKYRTKGANPGSVTQLMDATPSPDGVKERVAVADDVDTVPPAGAVSGVTQPAAPAVPKPSPKANPFGIAIVWLLSIAVIAFIVWNVMKYMRANPDVVGAKLQQLGVQIPKPADAPLSQGAPVAPAPAPVPQPIQKIVLPDAAPIPVAAAAPVAVSVGQPSLLSESGVAIPLADGETLVGREPGLGLSLTAESTVSRRHASLTKTGNDVTLADLGSSNGTYVNGAKLQSPVVLHQGDSIQFGSAKFQFVI